MIRALGFNSPPPAPPPFSKTENGGGKSAVCTSPGIFYSVRIRSKARAPLTSLSTKTLNW